MEVQALDWGQVKDAVMVLLALAGLIVLLGNVVKVIKDWKKPHDDWESWKRGVDKQLEDNRERMDTMEKGNKVICRGILALLSHEINGNSTEKLKASHTEMTNFLIDR